MLTDQLVATRKRERRLTVLAALAIVAATTSLALVSCTAVSAQNNPSPVDSTTTR